MGVGKAGVDQTGVGQMVSSNENTTILLKCSLPITPKQCLGWFEVQKSPQDLA